MIATATGVLALALAGCGGGAPGADSSAAAAGPSAAVSSSTPTPTATSTPKTHTNEELATLLSGLKDAQGQPFSVIPAAQVDQGIAKARQLLQSAVVTPAACNVFAADNGQIPEGSTYAGGTSQSAAEQTAVVVTVVAVKDPQIMVGQLAKSNEAAAQCATFTIEAGGQKITSQIQPVEVKTSGDKSFGALATQTTADGKTQTTLTVTALKGTLAATATKTGAAITADAAPELVRLADDILAKD
ncbi:MAG: hypothetical protein M3021_09955 [Actinomycetota bacterium]|nr:hypothetical protein [Actinomycetota bacterium]